LQELRNNRVISDTAGQVPQGRYRRAGTAGQVPQGTYRWAGTAGIKSHLFPCFVCYNEKKAESGMSEYKIYLVEDDEVIAEHVARQLGGWDYDVSIASDFEHVLDEFVRLSPQMVILDIGLPFFNGFHWCSEIRRISRVPILFLSSASDGMNQVLAMNMGGDDFVCKPFEMPVLAAKVQALLRRTYDFGAPQKILKAGGAVFNLSDGTLRFEGQEISLTKNEMKMLQLLFENKGSVVTRDALMQRLWDSDEFVDENTLTVNMTRLRRKLADMGIHDLIRTRKGLGYIAGENP